MPDLKDKVALITGASSGIGESTALHFASLGSWLALMARNVERLEKVAEACRDKGIPFEKVLVVPGDVSVESDVAAVVEKTVKHFGKIDILLCGGAAYSISKAALDHLTRHTALENAALGVRVNSVNPGVIRTPLGKQPGFTDEEHMKLLEEGTKACHVMGRIGRPGEVARCIAFLASENASFVTGVTLPVDGGLLLMSSLGPSWSAKCSGSA